MKLLKLVLSVAVLATAACTYAANPSPPHFPTLLVAPGGVANLFIRNSAVNGLPANTEARCSINTCGTSNNTLGPVIATPIPGNPGIVTSPSCVYSGDLNQFCQCQVVSLIEILGGSVSEGQTSCTVTDLLPPPYGSIPPSH
jgi:hypothetical protein